VTAAETTTGAPTQAEASPARPTKRELGAEAQRSTRARRRELFLRLHDLTQGHGLELGPLDAGIADPTTDDVSYVDVQDAAGLREHYADDANVMLELIPEIDFPLTLDGRVRTVAEAAAPGAPFDWVVASHVIEHVPDLIGWLQQLAELTVDDAALVLAVPDRRYCFDRHRPPTTVGEALAAFEEGHTRPSLRAVYDAFTYAVPFDLHGLWTGERPAGRGERLHDRAFVAAKLAQARAGEYVDCHVWTFTPESFLEQVKELRGLGLCEWYVESLHQSWGSLEFHSVLRRVPRNWDGSPLPEQELASDLPDWLEVEHLARTRRKRIKQLRSEVRSLRRRNDELAARVAALESSPVRRARRGLGRVARRLGLR
jgi:hypothetical protein